jgi:sigma-B regulation protein RsbU (phosphoserine phosphatase)
MRVVRDLSSDPDPISSVNRYATAMRRFDGDQGLVSVVTRGLPAGSYKVMRLLHQEGVGWKGFTDTFYAGPNAPAHAGGVIGEIIAGDRPVVLRNQSISDDPVMGNQLGPYRSIVAIPVLDRGVTTNWVLFLNTDPDSFSDRDVEGLVLQSNLMGSLTNSKRVAKELREANAWIAREIDEIAGIQRALLPDSMPDVPGLQLAATYETYDRAGGDYYDVLETGEDSGKWGLFIADASGHGPSAAVVVAMVSVLLQSERARTCCPGETLESLNRYLCAKSIRGSFVTAFYGIVDVNAGRLYAACAGHPAPLTRQSDGQVDTMPLMQGPPLGVVDGTTYSVSEHDLRSGDSVLLYTDGLTEGMSPTREMFGEERLAETFAASAGSARDRLHEVLHTLRTHEQGERPADDQTMLVVNIDGAQS